MRLSKIHQRVNLRRQQRGFFCFGGGISSSGGLTGNERSVRLRAAASAYLSRTFGTPTDNKKWSVSLWVKRGQLGANQHLFSAYGDNSNYFDFRFNTSDQLYVQNRVGGSNLLAANTTAVFRDPSELLHIVFVFDSANATAAYRNRLFVNNTEYTWSANSGSGDACAFNVASREHDLFGSKTAGLWALYDGVGAEVEFADGFAATDGTSFAKLNTNNIWVPKAYTGTYGNNGFHLNFQDTTSTTTLGYDVSGNGNHWTCNSISLTSGVTYDSMLDYPVNGTAANGIGCYATLDPLANRAYNANCTWSYGNLRLTNSSSRQHVLANMALPTTGKFKWEVRTDSVRNGYTTFGIASLNTVIANSPSAYYPTGVWGFRDGGSLAVNGTNTGSYSASAGTLWEFQFDADAGTLDCRNNGSTYCAQITGLTSGQYIPYFGIETPVVIDVTFGQRPFEGSGFSTAKALCTTNLPAPAVANPANGFQVVATTASSIDSSLASARSGWTDFLDIKKNRSNSGAWQYQFSHDSTHEYALAGGSLTYQSKSTNSGTDGWVGYSIRIGAAYGTAAGSVSHTNGADTTVTHSVGVSARQMILLFNRAGATAVPMYHPDLTSGKLLDLCAGSAEATSATIKTVTSTSFKIDAGTATGTYDYLVVSEQTGLFILGVFAGNGSADGPMLYQGGEPAATFMFDAQYGSGYCIFDKVRFPYNPTTARLLLNTNGAEGAAIAVDLNANGTKIRDSNSTINYSASTKMIYAAWLAHPLATNPRAR